ANDDTDASHHRAADSADSEPCALGAGLNLLHALVGHPGSAFQPLLEASNLGDEVNRQLAERARRHYFTFLLISVLRASALNCAIRADAISCVSISCSAGLGHGIRSRGFTFFRNGATARATADSTRSAM